MLGDTKTMPMSNKRPDTAGKKSTISICFKKGKTSICHMLPIGKAKTGIVKSVMKKIPTSTHLTDVLDMSSPVTNVDALLAPSSGLK
jgi:hypothetical protein